MKDKRDNQTAKCRRAIYDNRENLLNKRKIKVATAELSNGDKTIRKIFFSTDTAMGGITDIIRIFP